MMLIYLESTRLDLAWFRTYYGSVFQEGVARAGARYVKAVETLADNPYIGRPMGQDGLRKLVIPKTPFAIFYRVVEDRIEVVRIWDQRADPEKLEFHEEAAVLT